MNENSNGEFENTAEPDASPDVDEATSECDDNCAHPGLMYRAVYSTCYALSFGVSWPTLFALRALPANGAIRSGLAAGMLGATQSSDQVRAKVGHVAGGVIRTAEGAYANVAQRVQERVESVQDAIAERRYRRRLGGATA